jgi:hypothetical protein
VAEKTGGDGRRNNRPPVSGQFKPGQSGNKLGRKKGSHNHRTELSDQLSKTIAVTENGKRVRKRKSDVIIAQQINKALAGDLKAAQFIIEQMVKYGLLVEHENEPAKLAADDALVFEHIVRRIRDAKAESDPSDLPTEGNSETIPPAEEDRKP